MSYGVAMRIKTLLNKISKIDRKIKRLDNKKIKLQIMKYDLKRAITILELKRGKSQ